MAFFRFPWKISIQKKTPEKNRLHTEEDNENIEILGGEELSHAEANALPITIESTRGVSQNNIDGYLSQGYEIKGYKDAYDHQDTSYLELGKEFFLANILSLIKRSKALCIVKKTEIEAAMDTHKKLGEFNLVGELNVHLKRYDLDLDRLKEFETDITTQKGECNRILLSYERGFRKGLAEITKAKFQ